MKSLMFVFLAFPVVAFADPNFGDRALEVSEQLGSALPVVAALVFEFILRGKKSEKPLSILLAVSVFLEQLAKGVRAVSGLLDKILQNVK